jgi:hypothetical protein
MFEEKQYRDIQGSGKIKSEHQPAASIESDRVIGQRHALKDRVVRLVGRVLGGSLLDAFLPGGRLAHGLVRSVPHGLGQPQRNSGIAAELRSREHSTDEALENVFEVSASSDGEADDLDDAWEESGDQ